MTDYLIPLILFFTLAVALKKRNNAYEIMLDGASSGLRLLGSILPCMA